MGSKVKVREQKTFSKKCWIDLGIDSSARFGKMGSKGQRSRSHTNQICSYGNQHGSASNSAQLHKVSKKSSPILDCKRWTRSWSRFLGSPPTGDISHKPGGRLPLLSTRPEVTFPVKEITPLANSKLYCVVTEAYRCKRLAQGHYTMVPSQDSNPWPVNHMSNALPIAPSLLAS